MLFVEKAALIISEGSTPALPQQNEMWDPGGDLKKKKSFLRMVSYMHANWKASWNYEITGIYLLKSGVDFGVLYILEI